MRNDSRWRDRDWKWLVGILIGILILLVASFYNSDKVETNFSIISSAVSIALALVAIFIALDQSKDNKNLSSEMNATISIMHEKLNNVGEKVNKIDADILLKVLEQKMETVSEEMTENVANKSDISVEELNKLYSSELKQIKQELNHMLKETSKSNTMTTKYRVGDEVIHRKWGIGSVQKVIGTEKATELDIDFPEIGTKRLLAAFAPIEKVS
ncbi:hypothetical protein FZD47_24045 [Bacillus infantis]|uniref:Uncharacterized protein n=1 Tax=Bacillus infantis TaxID=324767 RepID=A0A5D4S5V4_9BACI|nr:hypothetical protein FZD47_24045 [Bacillus infantis]